MKLTAITTFGNFTNKTAPVVSKAVENSPNYNVMIDGQQYSIQSGGAFAGAANNETKNNFVAIA